MSNDDWASSGWAPYEQIPESERPFVRDYNISQEVAHTLWQIRADNPDCGAYLIHEVTQRMGIEVTLDQIRTYLESINE